MSHAFCLSLCEFMRALIRSFRGPCSSGVLHPLWLLHSFCLLFCRVSCGEGFDRDIPFLGECSKVSFCIISETSHIFFETHAPKTKTKPMVINCCWELVKNLYSRLNNTTLEEKCLCGVLVCKGQCVSKLGQEGNLEKWKHHDQNEEYSFS